MKEKINQLENLLTEITELIEQHIEIRNIDIGEYDSRYKDLPEDEKRKKEFVSEFREIIVSTKADDSFFEKDVPKIEALLSKMQRRLPELKKKLSHSKGTDYWNRPNIDIIKLLEQEILNTQWIISGEMKGKVFSGYLTEDGFLELNINGVKNKFASLRRAAIEAWGADIPSQWKFWKVTNEKGEEKSLEFYRNKLIN